MGQAQLGVAVQFVCSLHAFQNCPGFVDCTLFSLICTGLAAAKAARSLCGSGPKLLHHTDVLLSTKILCRLV